VGPAVWNEAKVRRTTHAAGFSKVSVSHNKRLMFAKAQRQQ